VPADRGVIVHAVLLAVARSAPAPGADVVLVSAGFAASLTVAFWWLFGHTITLAHEGGHALTTVLLGGAVSRLELQRDQTGATWLATGPLRRLLVLVAGYTGPSVFGLVGALVLRAGRADVVLWGSVVLLVWALTVAGNWFGRLVIVAVGATLFLFARSSSTDVQAIAACTWIWMLLVGGPIQSFEDGRRGSDHAKLRDATLIPVGVWAFAFSALSLAAAAASALVLVGLVSVPA